MKRRILYFSIISCVFLACADIENSKNDTEIVINETQKSAETMEAIENEEWIQFTSEEFVCTEKIYTIYPSPQIDVLHFEDLIFVNGDAYRYIDGHYDYLPEQGLIDKAPLEMEDAYVTQTSKALLYVQDVENDSGLVARVTLVDPYTRERINGFDIQAGDNAKYVMFESTYEDVIYCRTRTEDGGGTVERVDCIKMNQEIVFSAEQLVRSVIPRRDGTVMISVANSGWWVLDSQRRTRHLLEDIAGVCYEDFYWYDEAGYYTVIEYDNHVCELIRIKDDGTYERLYNMLGFDRLVCLEDYFIDINDMGKLYLYNYVYIPLEEEPHQEVQSKKEHQSFKAIQLVETEIFETGYRLDAYYICDDTVWLFLKDDEKNLVVRSWQFQTLEELNNSMKTVE